MSELVFTPAALTKVIFVDSDDEIILPNTPLIEVFVFPQFPTLVVRERTAIDQYDFYRVLTHFRTHWNLGQLKKKSSQIVLNAYPQVFRHLLTHFEHARIQVIYKNNFYATSDSIPLHSFLTNHNLEVFIFLIDPTNESQMKTKHQPITGHEADFLLKLTKANATVHATDIMDMENNTKATSSSSSPSSSSSLEKVALPVSTSSANDTVVVAVVSPDTITTFTTHGNAWTKALANAPTKVAAASSSSSSITVTPPFAPKKARAPTTAASRKKKEPLALAAPEQEKASSSSSSSAPETSTTTTTTTPKPSSTTPRKKKTAAAPAPAAAPTASVTSGRKRKPTPAVPSADGPSPAAGPPTPAPTPMPVDTAVSPTAAEAGTAHDRGAAAMVPAKAAGARKRSLDDQAQKDAAANGGTGEGDAETTVVPVAKKHKSRPKKKPPVVAPPSASPTTVAVGSSARPAVPPATVAPVAPGAAPSTAASAGNVVLGHSAAVKTTKPKRAPKKEAVAAPAPGAGTETVRVAPVAGQPRVEAKVATQPPTSAQAPVAPSAAAPAGAGHVNGDPTATASASRGTKQALAPLVVSPAAPAAVSAGELSKSQRSLLQQLDSATKQNPLR